MADEKSQSLDAMETNGSHAELERLSEHDDCIGALTRVSALASGVGAARGALGVDLASPGANAPLALNRVGQSLETSGLGPLLRALPIDPALLANLMVLTLLATCLRTIRHGFGIDLVRPDALPKLQAKVRSLSLGTSPTLRLPRVPAAGMARMTALAGSAGALRAGLGVDLRQPGAGAMLQGGVERMRAAGLSPALRAFPVGAATLGGLGSLVALTSGLGAMSAGLGVDPTKPQSAVRLEQLHAALRPNGALSVVTAQLASGSLGPGLALPPPHVAAQLTGLRASVAATQQNLGINLMAPNAGAQLQRMQLALGRDGVCPAARGASVSAADIDGVARLQAMASGCAAAAGAGVVAGAPDAHAALIRLVDGFHNSPAPDVVRSLSVRPAMITQLAGLANVASGAAG